MLIFFGVLLLVAIIAAFTVGILRVQKTAREEAELEEEPFFSLDSAEPAEGEEPEDPFGDPFDEPEEPAELVDLVDYYADESAEEAEPEEEQPQDVALLDADEHFDRLCNLKIGRGYLADCQSLLREMADTGQKFALCYFDFNRFRFINTLRGFSTGDYALTRIAQEAQLLMPDGALLTRLSADHFAALIIYIDDAQLEDLTEQLKRSSERIRSDVGAKSGLQVTMGVAITQTAADYDIFKLIRRANIARHCVKLSKSESYSVYDSSMVTSFLYGESALDDFSEHQYADDFILYLRPQLLMTSKRVTGCDAIPRWACEDANDSTPLSDGNLLPGSNLKVCYLACRTLNRWRKAGNIPLPVTMTIGEIDFFKSDIDAFFSRCTAEMQLEPSMLTVTVSLHAIRIEPEIAKVQMKKLSDIGVKVAVCDIDRGITSLELLEGAGVDFLKLHKSFAHGCDRLPERKADVQRIIAMARELGAGTIFEGADSATIVNALVGTGATIAQGRFVGNPSNIEDFTGQLSGFLQGSLDPSATVVLDDETMQKGDFKLY